MAIRLLRFARNDMEYRGFWGSLERVLQPTFGGTGECRGVLLRKDWGFGGVPQELGTYEVDKGFPSVLD